MKRAIIIVGFLATIPLVWWLWPADDTRVSGRYRTLNVQQIVAGVDIPHQGRARYSSSENCRECHGEQYESWHDSYHRTMTQVASEESIVAPFEGESVSSLGRRFTMRKEGSAFVVDMPDPEWEIQQARQGVDLTTVTPPETTKRVVLTTGSHHLQTYWIPSQDGNKLRQLPWVYHIAQQRWMPNESSFLSAPGQASEILANRHYVYWNYFCINCHSVGGQMNLEYENTWDTRVAEFGISCEACHGPAQNHVAFHRAANNGVKANFSAEEARLINPADCDPKLSAQICGQCHSDNDWKDKENSYLPGDNLLTHCNLYQASNTFEPQRFWGDGTMRVGGREYLPMIESACFKQGDMSCVSCHSMHDSDPNDQLASGMETNEACFQCHETYREKLTEHTHHAPESTGSLCYNCHMPHTTYALFKGIRSHRIDSPSVLSSVKHGRPNGCNQCHVDQTLQWTAGHLKSWYGITSGPIPQIHQEYPASAVWITRGNAIQRALAAWNYRWEPAVAAGGQQWQFELLKQLLNDEYAAVRLVAYESLRSRPGLEDWEYDYVAPIEARQASIRQLEERKPDLDPNQFSSAVNHLFDSQGKLEPAFYEKMLRQRDQTPINISE